jgi:hypothetical protein
MSDMEALFSEKAIQHWGLRGSVSLEASGEARGLVLRWSTLADQYSAQLPDEDDSLWFIVCDTLIIDSDISVEFEMVLFARQIQVEGVREIHIGSDAEAVTIVFQKIIAGSSNNILTATGPGLMKTVALSGPQMHVANGSAIVCKLTSAGQQTREIWNSQCSVIPLLASALDDGQLLRLGIGSIFQTACLISQSHPEIAADQFRWIAQIVTVNPGTRLMAAQAQTMLGWIIQEQHGLIIVPPLDFIVYAQAASEQNVVLANLVATYEKWIDRDWQDSKWLDDASLSVTLRENDAKLAGAIVHRAEDKLAGAKSALASASDQLNFLKVAFSIAHHNFDAGVEIWKAEERAKAIVNLIVNIVKLGAEIGKMVAAGKGGGTDAATGEAGAAEGEQIEGAGEIEGEEAQIEGDGEIEETSETASGETTEIETKSPSTASSASDGMAKAKAIMGTLGDVGEAGGKVVGSVEKIIEIGAAADKLHAMATNTVAAVDTDLSLTFTTADLKGLDLLTGGEQVWEMLKAGMDDLFSTIEKQMNEIGGGPAFRVVFHKLVIGAEAYCNARLAIASASNALAEARLRQQTANLAVDLTQKYQTKINTDKSLYCQLQQAAFDQILDAKRTVYLEFQKYRQAIRYFTLDKEEELPRLPDISASFEEFVSGCSRISGYELAMAGLVPRPQPMSSYSISHIITADDHAVTGKENDTVHAIAIRIDLNSPQLKRLARVRIDQMDVELRDIAGNPISVDVIYISTNGTYADRSADDRNIQVTAESWEPMIDFHKDGTEGTSAAVYSRYGQLIFKPTPFTIWTIRPEPASALDSAHEIILTFSGESTRRLQVPE